MKRAMALASCGLVAIAWSLEAGAQPETKKLGDAGTNAIGGQLGAGITQNDAVGPMKTNAVGVLGGVMFDRFIADHLSLGVIVSGSHASVKMQEASATGTTKMSSALVGARLGVLLPVSDRLAFWPVLHVGTAHAWSRTTFDAGGPDRSDGPSIRYEAGLDAQMLFHVSDHLYLQAVTGGVKARTTSEKYEGGRHHLRNVSLGFNGIMFFGLGGWF